MATLLNNMVQFELFELHLHMEQEGYYVSTTNHVHKVSTVL